MKILKLVVLVLTVGFFTTNASAQMAEKKMDHKMESKKMTNDNVTVIELTQVDGAFTTSNLDLKPGKYQFRVVNSEVNKEVGFLIQTKENANADPMKTAVENSFSQALIKKGTAEYTGIVTLTEGEYVYSCPLNPTPKYSITVKK